MDTITSGIISSVLTEVLKFIPYLRKNSLTEALTNLVVTGVVVFFYNGWSLSNFIAALLSGLVTYKAAIRPLAQSVGSNSQAAV